LEVQISTNVAVFEPSALAGVQADAFSGCDCSNLACNSSMQVFTLQPDNPWTDFDHEKDKLDVSVRFDPAGQ